MKPPAPVTSTERPPHAVSGSAATSIRTLLRISVGARDVGNRLELEIASFLRA